MLWLSAVVGFSIFKAGGPVLSGGWQVAPLPASVGWWPRASLYPTDTIRTQLVGAPRLRGLLWAGLSGPASLGDPADSCRVPFLFFLLAQDMPRPSRSKTRRSGSWRRAQHLTQPANAAELDRAVTTMRGAMLAESTKATYRSRLKLWEQLSRNMGLKPFPLDEVKMERVTAALREGKYKSAADFLTTAMAYNEMAGFKLTKCQRAYARRIKVACKQNIGRPKQAEPLTLGVLMSLCKSATGFHEMQRVASYVLGSRFLLRGDELLGLTLSNVSVSEDSVTITIDGSKTDQQRCGEERRLGAISAPDGEDIGLVCPVRAASYLIQSRTEQRASLGDPLCANRAGCAWGQKAFRQALKKDLAKAGVEGWIGYSLHSMRAGGCQWLLKAGIERNKVKKFGRWRSNCIDRYAREAYIADSAGYTSAVVGLPSSHPTKSAVAVGEAESSESERQSGGESPPGEPLVVATDTSPGPGVASGVESEWIVEDMLGTIHPWLR
ncbi:hypothetical protein FOZ63_031008 [Perkinsus olseni]|uniref:Tyr recombinase domain-containing protein n=1 Tax=Perkinsus olseni TaxID=32597 RepID=A0A7J6QQC7_PEROL|nr:hypothetical protein FOZ63_031008 [Perkinsus olseni]KAF4739269.1 hypothetical protein FOZ62_028783 [Perkinsus olseni]